MPISPEVIHRLKECDTEEESVRLLNAHVLTTEERVRLAQDGYGIADIINGRVEGGLGRYRDLAVAVNERLGFQYFFLSCF